MFYKAHNICNPILLTWWWILLLIFSVMGFCHYTVEGIFCIHCQFLSTMLFWTALCTIDCWLMFHYLSIWKQEDLGESTGFDIVRGHINKGKINCREMAEFFKERYHNVKKFIFVPILCYIFCLIDILFDIYIYITKKNTTL